MRTVLFWLGRISAVVCVAALAACHVTSERHLSFRSGLQDWLVEQTPGGTVQARADGTLVIEDALGCSVWYREQLRAPVEIEYDVTVVAQGGPRDRVADVNCFWMASDPRISGLPRGRSGRFGDYDNLRTYYVGVGGNDNTTTRFRRYLGDGQKPLLPGHDLRKPEFLLEGNRTYHIRLVARNGVAEFWRDGRRIFMFVDAHPLTEGWFAFRTLHSHLEIRNVRITQHPR